MGLYQLVLAVYSLFITLATAGVSVAATRLMAEELSGPASARGAARGMLRRLLAAGLVLGLFAAALQLATADLAARLWLGDVRAVGALRVSALGMPWMAVSAVLRGFFIARRQVEPNVLSQLAEQTVRIGIVWAALERADVLGWDVGGRCTAVLGATAVSEAVSTGLMALFTVKRPVVASVRGLPAARRSRESASGTFSGRWREDVVSPALSTPRRICWCRPVWQSICNFPAGVPKPWPSTAASKGWPCLC